MANIVIRCIATTIIFVILKLYNVLCGIQGAIVALKDYIRLLILKATYNGDRALITQEIKPKINKKMEHVAICCAHSINHMPDNQVNRLCKLIDWFLLCEVKYVTLYFEDPGRL